MLILLDNTRDYTEFCRTTAIYPGALERNTEELVYLSLGLAGEAGEVANKVKKLLRDGKDMYSIDAVRQELGDVMWYLTRLADMLGVTLNEVMRLNTWKLQSRADRGKLKGSGDNR